MKIALTTHGTRGDVQPFVALALALMERGHDVILGVPVNLVHFVEKCGVRAGKLAVDTQAFLESDKGRAWLSSGNASEFMKQLGAVVSAHRDELMDDFLRICEGADVLVTGVLTEDYVSTIAEARQLPMLSVHFNPMRPNVAYANALVTTWALPGFLNRFTGSLAEMAWWSAYKADVNAFRAKLGLKKTSQSTARRLSDQSMPILHAFSPAIVPRPKDYDGESLPVVGTIRFPDSARARLGEAARDPHLVAWLAKGSAPVFFGLGSMPIKDPAAMLKTVEAVTKTLGVRAVIGAGWSKMNAAGLSDQLFITGAVDHGWLFPQCRAAVHHGGAGTVVAALTDGLPSIITSVFADQPFWGARIERLGAGVHLPFSKLNDASLEAALRRVLEPGVTAAAQKLGAALKAEPDATPVIVARIEAAAKRRAAAA